MAQQGEGVERATFWGSERVSKTSVRSPGSVILANDGQKTWTQIIVDSIFKG